MGTSLGLIILTATGGSTNMQSAPDKESALAILALANAFLVMKVKPANVKLVPTLALVTEDVSTSKTLAMLQLHSTLLVSEALMVMIATKQSILPQLGVE